MSGHLPVVTQVTRYDIRLKVLYVRPLIRAHVEVFWRESDGNTESTHERKCLKQFSNRGEFECWLTVQRSAGFKVNVSIQETCK